MYEDSYLVPANAKKGTLIFNLFRKVDLIIFASGVAFTLLLLAFTSGSSDNIWILILKLIPAGVCALLVLPIPNYHNTLCAIQSIISFYTERRRFLWKGWCFYEKFNDDKSKK